MRCLVYVMPCLVSYWFSLPDLWRIIMRISFGILRLPGDWHFFLLGRTFWKVPPQSIFQNSMEEVLEVHLCM